MMRRQERTAAGTRTRSAAGTALAVVTATLMLLAVLAAESWAGEYHVYSCRTPSGQVAPTDGWSAPEHSGEDVTADTCEDPGGGLIAGLDAHVSHPAETDKATWAFEAPDNETIAGATLWRAGENMALANPETSYTFWLSGVADTGPQSEIFEECAQEQCPNKGNFAEPLAPENRIVVPEGGLGGRYIYLNVSCGSLVASCAATEAGDRGYAATIELFAADLVLSQSESPAVSDVGGSLAEAPTVSGTSDVAFEATDGGSGVYEVVFRVDGQVVSTVVPEEEGGRCHNVGGTTDGLPAFLYTQPCPPALSVDLPFDTTGLSNGAHHLLVSVLDAAGNSATVLDRQITVADAATTGGGSSGNGSDGGGSAGNGSSGSGTSGSGTGSTSGAGGLGGASSGAAPSVAAPGPANGVNASEEATLTAAWKGHAGELLSDGYGAGRTIEGRLTAPGGAAIADAQIEVSELPAYAGARERALPVVRTGSAGRWRIELPRGISSGELLVAYRSHVGDATPAATRTLTLSVRAGLTLSIAPHIARAQGAIRFGGRLLGGPVPAGGKQLVLEARSPGGRWLEFHVIRGRAADGGRFGFAYRFHLAGPANYQFRVLCEAEADYPFAAGSSNVVRVYER
jgi:hypothetical protein